MPLLTALTQQEVLRQPGADVLQQDPSIYTLCHASQEEEMAMLDPLEDHLLVLKVGEEVGQVFVRGVKGQLGEGQRGDRARAELFCLLLEICVRDGCQHVEGIVNV